MGVDVDRVQVMQVAAAGREIVTPERAQALLAQLTAQERRLIAFILRKMMGGDHDFLDMPLAEIGKVEHHNIAMISRYDTALEGPVALDNPAISEALILGDQWSESDCAVLLSERGLAVVLALLSGVAWKVEGWRVEHAGVSEAVADGDGAHGR